MDDAERKLWEACAIYAQRLIKQMAQQAQIDWERYERMVGRSGP